MGKKVLVVDDDPDVRLFNVPVLEEHGYTRLLGTNGEEGRNLAKQEKPDLVILDVVLPDLDGLEVLSRLRSKLPNMPIIMITAHARPSTIKEAVRRGARGFVTKGTPLSELRTAVAKVLSGGRYFCSVTSPLLADALSQKTVDDTLSPRQREILRLVASGMSSKEIASQLDISVKTVSNHRLQISERLGFTDVASWTRYAMEQGLIEAKL